MSLAANREALEAYAARLEAIGDPNAPMVRSMVIRCDIEQRRDDRVEEMLTTAERIAGGAIATKAALALPGAIEKAVLQRWWLAAGAVGALFAASISGAYLLGERTGRAAGEERAVHLEAAIGQQLTRADAEGWLALLHNNDSLGAAPHICAPAQDGRRVCHLDLWASPPVAPPPSGQAQAAANIPTTKTTTSRGRQ